MYKIGRSIFMIIACISCSISLPVHADRIEGKVSPIPQGNTFEIVDAEGSHIRTVSVNSKGEFTVYLRPGLYRAVSNERSATIRSEEMPMRNQRIIFK